MTLQAEAWADSVCGTLSLRQKAAQMLMPAIYSSDDRWTLRQAADYASDCIGGVVLLKGDIAGARAIADTLQAGGKIPPFVAIDAEWGLAMRLADAPRMEGNRQAGQHAGESEMYDCGRTLASECRAIGIGMVLGPVVDVSSPGSVMWGRSYGSDPHKVADLALAFARGLEDGNVISVAKHFPGHGSVTLDSHVTTPVISRSLHAMDSIDLYPFRRWVEDGLSAVMVGHLAVPALDSEMLPSAVSATVITDLLRGDLGFKGLVLTDALNMKGASGHSAVEALIAGADIILAPVSTAKETAEIVKAVEEARISPATVDDRVKRILFYKFLQAPLPACRKNADNLPGHQKGIPE